MSSQPVSSLKDRYMNWLRANAQQFVMRKSQRAQRNAELCLDELLTIAKNSHRDTTEYLFAYVGCETELPGYFLATQLGITANQPIASQPATQPVLF